MQSKSFVHYWPDSIKIWSKKTNSPKLNHIFVFSFIYFLSIIPEWFFFSFVGLNWIYFYLLQLFRVPTGNNFSMKKKTIQNCCHIFNCENEIVHSVWFFSGSSCTPFLSLWFLCLLKFNLYFIEISLPIHNRIISMRFGYFPITIVVLWGMNGIPTVQHLCEKIVVISASVGRIWLQNHFSFFFLSFLIVVVSLHIIT